MPGKIIVAIDGHSSCGKSTLARDLANKLHYKYIDTGAMYRAVTLYFLDQKVNTEDPQAILNALKNIYIDFIYDHGTDRQLVTLNGEVVEKSIREMRVTENVSEISTFKIVREKLVEKQKAFGIEKGIVMDGRDIGIVVFPAAELKIFLTAEKKVRVQRRYDELRDQNKELSFEEVKKNLEHRDHLDTHRQISPLKKAPDALVLDNTQMSISRQTQWAYERALEKLEENKR